MTEFVFGSVACAGSSVNEESTAAFAAVGGLLEARGLSLADVVRTRLLYTTREDYPPMSEVREPLFRETFRDGSFPAAAGFATGGRGGNSPRFELEIVACRPKTVRNSPAVISAFGGRQPPFAHANEAKGVIFISGQTAFESDGSFPDRTPGQQARKVLETVAPIAAEFGSTVRDVIALTVFVDASVDDAAYAEVHDAVADFVAASGRPGVVVTCVDVAELVFPGAQVGMEAVAVVPGAEVRHALGPCSIAAVDGFFVASSASPTGESLDRACAAAGDSFRAAVREIGFKPASGALVTVWYSGEDRAAAELSAHKALRMTLQDAHLSLVPLQLRTGAPPVIFEIYGACELCSPQETT